MLILLAALLADGPSPEGRWTNPSGSVTIAIDSCASALCGTVVAASDKAKADAARGGTKTLVGTQLLSGFTAAGPSKWRGRLFVPDLNKRPRATIQMLGASQLKVTGCAVGRVACRSQVWTRAAP